MKYHSQQYVANIEELVSRTTDKLHESGGIEALRDCIVDTESKLRSGSLRCAYEVEVSLISNAMVSFNPSILLSVSSLTVGSAIHSLVRFTRDT